MNKDEQALLDLLDQAIQYSPKKEEEKKEEPIAKEPKKEEPILEVAEELAPSEPAEEAPQEKIKEEPAPAEEAIKEEEVPAEELAKGAEEKSEEEPAEEALPEEEPEKEAPAEEPAPTPQEEIQEKKKDIKFLILYLVVFVIVISGLIGGSYLVSRRIHKEMNENNIQSNHSHDSTLKNIQNQNKELKEKYAESESKNAELTAQLNETNELLQAIGDMVEHDQYLADAQSALLREEKDLATSLFRAIDREKLSIPNQANYDQLKGKLGL